MAAIITEEFRRNSAQLLLNDIGTVPHYLCIGQQSDWAENIGVPGAPYPKGTVGDTRRATQGLTGMFRIEATAQSLVIPKINLTSTDEYKVYSPFDPTCFYSDTDANVLPCYAMLDPNLIFLCIHKTPGTSTMQAQDIADNLGSSGLEDYGIATVGGYTWVYIGRYDQYNFINNNEFVSFQSDVTLSPNAPTASYASAEINPAGLDNNFIVIATDLYVGNAGNALSVALSESANSPAVPGTITHVDSSGEWTFTYDAGTSAQQLIDYINAIDIGTRPFDASGSGDSDGVLADVMSPAISLTGGNSSGAVIKAATGGIVHGFTLLYGGEGYSRVGDLEDELITTTVDATLYGIDEYGETKSNTLTVDIDYDNRPGEKKLLDVRLKASDITTGNRFFGYDDVRIELTDWTLANNYSDPTTAAHIIVHVGPLEGFGYRKDDTLPAWYIGLYADTGTALYTPDTTEYHQISLIREPLKSDGVTQLTAEYAQPLNYFELGTTGNDWSYDTQVVDGWTILQDDEKVGILSHVQRVVSNTDATALDPIRYYYYGDYFNGYRPIVPGGGTIKFVSPDGVTTVDTAFNVANVVISPNYKPHSGKLIFEDNRGTVTRAEGQNEELKVIIQL